MEEKQQMTFWQIFPSDDLVSLVEQQNGVLILLNTYEVAYLIDALMEIVSSEDEPQTQFEVEIKSDCIITITKANAQLLLKKLSRNRSNIAIPVSRMEH